MVVFESLLFWREMVFLLVIDGILQLLQVLLSSTLVLRLILLTKFFTLNYVVLVTLLELVEYVLDGFFQFTFISVKCVFLYLKLRFTRCFLVLAHFLNLLHAFKVSGNQPG